MNLGETGNFAAFLFAVSSWWELIWATQERRLGFEVSSEETERAEGSGMDGQKSQRVVEKQL